MKRHRIKCHRVPFQAIVDRTKSFEWRLNDRDYKVGDEVELFEIDERMIATGREITVSISYLVTGGNHGLPPDFCVFQWKEVLSRLAC